MSRGGIGKGILEETPKIKGQKLAVLGKAYTIEISLKMIIHICINIHIYIDPYMYMHK